MKRAYIWSLPTRLFHWMLALFIAIAFIVSEEENLLDIHAAFGYGVGVLIVFRIIWGFIGPKYSKFSDFPLNIKEAIEFSKNIFNPKKSYAGHNPAASFVMLGIIVVALLVVVSGVLTYGTQEAKGVFAFLNHTIFKKMELFKEIHEALTTILLILIGAHIAGVVTDRILHKEAGVLESIFKGYKNIDAPSVKLNIFQKVISAIFLIASIAVVIWALQSNSPLTKQTNKEYDYESRAPLFYEECASCHTLYPPFLLPKESWVKIMNSLDNHFGDDASLDEKSKNLIERFLVANSSEHSTKEAAFYIMKDFKKGEIAITNTKYWKQKHSNIDKEIFKSKRVKSKANCKACHSKIEQGLIEDNQIKVPK